MLTLSFCPCSSPPGLCAALAAAGRCARPPRGAVARAGGARARRWRSRSSSRRSPIPSLIREDREPVKDVVAVVVDRSTSQTLGDRAAMTDKVRAELQRRLRRASRRRAALRRRGRRRGRRRHAAVRGAVERASPTCRRTASPASSWSPTASSTTSRPRPRSSASARRCTRSSPAARTSATAASC